jgi:hypothetical protein
MKHLSKIAVLSSLVLVSVGMTACSTSAPTAPAGAAVKSAGKADTLRLALGSVGTYDAPVILANTLGYAKKNGLSITETVVGVNITNIILAGQADVAQGGVGSPLPAISSGKATKIVYAMESGAVSATVIGKPSIHKFSDCKTIVTSPAGSNAYSATAAYIEAANTKPSVIQLAAVDAIVPAVLSGQADCAVNAVSNLLKGLKSGLHVVVNPQKPSTMPDKTILQDSGVVLFGYGPNLKSKRPAMVKLMKSINQAVTWMKSHSSAEIADALAKDPNLAAFTKEQLITSYNADKPFLVPNGGEITPTIWAGNVKLYSHSFSYIADGSSKWSFGNVTEMSYLKAAKAAK